MMMVIDLHTQRAEVYRDGVRIGVSTVSTGKPGHRTPTGTYTVLEKQRFHRSSRYNNAPMPYMQRLTWYGIALHGGHLPGRPASHGCVRLPHAFAEALFWESTIGMKVIITDQAPGKENVTLSSTLNPRTGLQSCAAG
jgi:lipoprotein-anchoring transpeptidase ErfK/SrfK